MKAIKLFITISFVFFTNYSFSQDSNIVPLEMKRTFPKNGSEEISKSSSLNTNDTTPNLMAKKYVQNEGDGINKKFSNKENSIDLNSKVETKREK